jgi:hypothetical protein
MLGFTRPRQDPTDEPEDPALAADVEAIVADPAEIARTLGEVNRAHCLLHVAREGSANTHVSVLLEVDQEAAHVLIDELSTAAVDAGTRLEVSTQLGGILIRFASTMREHARDRQGGYYRLDFPHHMQRVQRRAYHRVTVARDLGIRVVLAQDETTYEGEILDISVGGISLTLPGQPAWQDPGGLHRGRATRRPRPAPAHRRSRPRAGEETPALNPHGDPRRAHPSRRGGHRRRTPACSTPS